MSTYIQIYKEYIYVSLIAHSWHSFVYHYTDSAAATAADAVVATAAAATRAIPLAVHELFVVDVLSIFLLLFPNMQNVRYVYAGYTHR